MKTQAIITTLLDRQAILLHTLLERQKLDLITPRLFAATTQRLGNQFGATTHIIEDQLQETEEKDSIKAKVKEAQTSLSQQAPQLKTWFEQQGLTTDLTSQFISAATSRTEKIISLYEGLDKLSDELDIRALIVNQEYLIHEATLVQWAKSRNVPVIHFCHSPYIGRNLGSIRHFLSDHITLASDRCNEVLDDLCTGKGQRHTTGMVNWDTYRSLDLPDIEQLTATLNPPEDALIISFFTTYAVNENATSDPETYEKTLDAFLTACQHAYQNCDRTLFFIIKDRPTGNQFSYEQVMNKARKLGIEKNLAYIFDRPEKVVLFSDITVSPGSSIAVESMAMGKATIELIARQVFLGGLCFAANDGVIQATPTTLPDDLLNLCKNEEKRETLADQAFENTTYVEATQALDATRQATALLLDVIGEPSLAEQTRQDENFYDQLNLRGTDSRFVRSDAYKTWRERTKPTEVTGQLMGERYLQWQQHPVFHLVLVLDKTLFSALANTLESLETQIYSHFGVSIISTEPAPETFAADNNKLQWIESSNPFIDINEVCSAVEADWILQIWPGDELHPQALFHFADYINLNPEWMAVYADEALMKQATLNQSVDDQTRTNHELASPIFKPDFNLDLLRSTDYVNRCITFRKDAWQALGGYTACGYRQNEDLAFRLAERMTLPAIGHAPFICNYRGTFTDALQSHTDFEEIGSYIRAQHLQRLGFTHASIKPGLHAGIYTCQFYTDPPIQQVDLLLATSHLDEHLLRCLLTFKEHWDDRLQLTIGSPYSSEQVQNWLAHHDVQFAPTQAIQLSGGWHGVAKAWQQLVEQTSAEVFILTYPDIRAAHDQWLEPLLDQLSRQDVAAAGPRLVDTLARLKSAGQILGKDGLIGDLYRGFFLEQELPGLQRAWCTQSFNSLNPAFLAIKRAEYLAQEGLDPEYHSLLSMNDLLLRFCLNGKKLIWTPEVTFALGSRGVLEQAASSRKEQVAFRQRWFKLLCNDPAYNPNLALRGAGNEPDNLLSGPWHPAYHQRTRVLFCNLDMTREQATAMTVISGQIRSLIHKELISEVHYSYLASSETPPISPAELGRAAPDHLLLTGKPDNIIHSLAASKELLPELQYHLVIASEQEWQQWRPYQQIIDHWLVADSNLIEVISSNSPEASTWLIEEDNPELQPWLALLEKN